MPKQLESPSKHKHWASEQQEVPGALDETSTGRSETSTQRSRSTRVSISPIGEKGEAAGRIFWARKGEKKQGATSLTDSWGSVRPTSTTQQRPTADLDKAVEELTKEINTATQPATITTSIPQHKTKSSPELK
ncbi:hypothetical protein TSAR_001165 [Trichomalopsis sarcophagae]|uniref:Uncharacterized protein n=1 Tax=Trichomalopsis sarcophagae TaxID=543379 RepID=A0A232EPZ5_9HYME|nr:hypothetical protein TSAR_001165 [Trichomalopsis sarcophagae]